MITVVYSLSQFRLPGSPTVMIITAPSQHSSLPSFIFLILLHFYITSTPFPARLSLSPATPLPLPSAPFSHPISYIRVTFLMSPPPNRLSLFMCVWGVGAIQPRFILLPSNLRRNLFLLAVTYIYIYTVQQRGKSKATGTDFATPSNIPALSLPYRNKAAQLTTYSMRAVLVVLPAAVCKSLLHEFGFHWMLASTVLQAPEWKKTYLSVLPSCLSGGYCQTTHALYNA
jgi:hypothetical protein